MRGGSVPAMPAHIRFVLSVSKDGGRGWLCPPWFDWLTTNRGELVFPNDRPLPCPARCPTNPRP